MTSRCQLGIREDISAERPHFQFRAIRENNAVPVPGGEEPLPFLVAEGRLLPAIKPEKPAPPGTAWGLG